jgi:sulfite dehydrogenase (cytochrome) subunit B
MTKTISFVAVLGVLGAGAAFAAGPPAPKATVSISLPGDAGFAFKPGPGAESAQRYCLTCHSSAYVSTQPVLTKAQWTAEVTKMKAVFGAPIPDEQVAPIVDYLTASYGSPQ